MKELQNLMDEGHKWSCSVFGEKYREILMLHHLKEEVDELIESIENNNTDNEKVEFADIFLLTINTASRRGYNAEDLINFTHRKIELNKLREWEPADEKGIIRHKK